MDKKKVKSGNMANTTNKNHNIKKYTFSFVHRKNRLHNIFVCTFFCHTIIFFVGKYIFLQLYIQKTHLSTMQFFTFDLKPQINTPKTLKLRFTKPHIFLIKFILLLHNVAKKKNYVWFKPQIYLKTLKFRFTNIFFL